MFSHSTNVTKKTIVCYYDTFAVRHYRVTAISMKTTVFEERIWLRDQQIFPVCNILSIFFHKSFSILCYSYSINSLFTHVSDT